MAKLVGKAGSPAAESHDGQEATAVARDTRTPIQRLYQAFDPKEVIGPDDPRYQNFDDVRSKKFAQQYANAIRGAGPSNPMTHTLAGHIGVGKSSELARIRRLLETPSEESGQGDVFRIINVDFNEMDLNDIDWPDILVFIAAEVLKDLREKRVPGFDPFTSLIKDRWDELKRVLGSRITFKDVSIDAQFATLAVEMKTRASSRGELRSAIENQATGLLDALNDVLVTAQQKLTAQGLAGIVLFVDSLERIYLRDLGSGRDTQTRLFIDRATQWASLGVHTILTIPITILFHQSGKTVDHILGGIMKPLPMVRLHEWGAPIRPENAGMRGMRALVEKRCAYARLSTTDVFESDASIDRLCEMSGGHPRTIQRLLREAIVQTDELPIKAADVERAVRAESNSMVRTISEKYWELLRGYDEPCRIVTPDDSHRDMLYYQHIYEYMNGEPWFEINPVLRLHSRFRSA